MVVILAYFDAQLHHLQYRVDFARGQDTLFVAALQVNASFKYGVGLCVNGVFKDLNDLHIASEFQSFVLAVFAFHY